MFLHNLCSKEIVNTVPYKIREMFRFDSKRRGTSDGDQEKKIGVAD